MSHKETILDTVTTRAGAQYDDSRGTVAVDDSDSGQGGLDGLARLLGAKGFPVGMSLYKSKGPLSEFIGVSLYTLADSYGSVASYDKAREIVDASNGKVKTRRYSCSSMPVHEFLDLFKRFDLFMLNKGINVEEFEVVEETQTDDES